MSRIDVGYIESVLWCDECEEESPPFATWSERPTDWLLGEPDIDDNGHVCVPALCPNCKPKET